MIASIQRPILVAGAAAAILGLSAVAQAQVATNGINVVVADAELLPGESTTIRLEAYFGGTDYAVAGVATSLRSTAGSQGLSDLTLIAPMDGPGTEIGVIDGSGVSSIIAGQLNFPATGAIFADPTNPIPFWEVTYTAPTDVAAPFDVLIGTLTTRFDVYVDRDSSLSQSRLDDFAEGEGAIRVIPAPAVWLLPAVGVASLACRRRRS